MNTNLSKLLVVPVAAAAFSLLTTGSAKSEIIVGGPGLPVGSYRLSDMQDQIQVNLGEYYKYEVYGYYGRLDAGVPLDGWVDSLGRIYSLATPPDWSGTKQELSSRLLANVNVGSSTAGDQLELVASNVRETTGDVVIQRSSVLKLDQEDVTLAFQLDSNVKHPSGYLVVMGVGVKQPPKPTGELIVPTYALAETNPLIGWTIKRDADSIGQEGYDSTMTIELPDYDSPDDTTDSNVDSNDEDVPTTVDDGWKGNGKNNNGHGNNVDGIDVSNPGKGKGGPNGQEDTDYDGDGVYEDDEKKGW